MDILTGDFIVNSRKDLTPSEMEFLRCTVNGWELPNSGTKEKIGIIKKMGAKSWPHAIALCFKNGTVSLCFALALVLGSSEITSKYDFNQQDVEITRTRTRTRTRNKTA